MNKAKHGDCPRCRRDTCFANDGGYCYALRDNKFNGDCPFYKERWQKRLEDLRCEARVNAIKEQQKYERQQKQLERKTLDSG